VKESLLIGIAGPSGSGKTSVSDNLNSILGPGQVLILQEDNYYRDLSEVPVSEQGVRNFDHPDAFDHELLFEHLKALLSGNPVETPVYDFRQYRRLETVKKLGPHRIVVLEGILILHSPKIRDLMDIRVYVDQDPDVCLIRRLRRDLIERGRTVESVLDQYEATVRPMFLQFVEPSKRYADIIITGGGHNLVAIDLLATKIRSLIEIKENRPTHSAKKSTSSSIKRAKRGESRGKTD
jgi:uridine kinase